MRPFSIWLAVTLLVYGGFGGGYHYYLTENPRKVAVVIDASFAMQPVWIQVPGILEKINAQRYAQFSLATEKGPIHGWSTSLKLGRTAPYAPRNFSRLMSKKHFPEMAEATEIQLITNAGPALTKNLSGFKIMRLAP